MPVRIDPNTGERIEEGVQIDPQTGERMTAPPRSMLDTAADFGKGLLKGAVHTMSAADDFAGKHLPSFMTTPIGQTPNAENSARAIQAAKDIATPHNTAQSFGRGAEQAAEFLIPGGAEKALVGKGATLLPRMIASGVGSGLVNATQGGSFAGGAAAGVAGTGIAAGLSKVAPSIAETAIGVRGGADRAFGRTPGQSILAETTGVRPGSIAKQSLAKIGQYGDQLDTGANNSTIPVDLMPARSTAQKFLNTATLQNEPGTINEVQGLKDILTHRPTGPINQIVPASEALALKRGVGAYKGSWNPATQHDLADRAVDATYGAMHPGLEMAIPEYGELNSKISSLLPVAKRAGATDLNAGIIQRMIARGSAHTGAMAGPLALGAAGAAQHGILGGFIGAGAGLLGQEVATNPAVLMTGARIAASPKLGNYVLPALTGIAAQATRKKENQQ